MTQFKSQGLILLLGAFAKWRKATIYVVMDVHPDETTGSQWTDFVKFVL
jgi:hypothetical protein